LVFHCIEALLAVWETRAASALGSKNSRYQRLGDSGDALICFRRSPIETPSLLSEPDKIIDWRRSSNFGCHARVQGQFLWSARCLKSSRSTRMGSNPPARWAPQRCRDEDRADASLEPCASRSFLAHNLGFNYSQFAKGQYFTKFR